MPTTDDGKIVESRFAVDRYGMGDEVLKMHKDGVSLHKMAEVFAKKGMPISHSAISSWLTAQKENFNKHLDAESYKKYHNMIVSYRGEILGVLDEVKKLKAQAIEEKNLEIYVKLIGRLYEGLELLAKLMGDIKPQGNVDVNVIINEINKATYTDNQGVRKTLFSSDEKIYDAEFEEVKEDETAKVSS